MVRGCIVSTEGNQDDCFNTGARPSENLKNWGAGSKNTATLGSYMRSVFPCYLPTFQSSLPFLFLYSACRPQQWWSCHGGSPPSPPPPSSSNRWECGGAPQSREPPGRRSARHQPSSRKPFGEGCLKRWWTMWWGRAGRWGSRWR